MSCVTPFKNKHKNSNQQPRFGTPCHLISFNSGIQLHDIYFITFTSFHLKLITLHVHWLVMKEMGHVPKVSETQSCSLYVTCPANYDTRNMNNNLLLSLVSWFVWAGHIYTHQDSYDTLLTQQNKPTTGYYLISNSK